MLWRAGSNRVGDHYFVARCRGHASPFQRLDECRSESAEIRPTVADEKRYM
jgi:hypothetical protein